MIEAFIGAIIAMYLMSKWYKKEEKSSNLYKTVLYYKQGREKGQGNMVIDIYNWTCVIPVAGAVIVVALIFKKKK